MSRTRGAVIYTRVSTGEQDKHGTSPESQLENCRKKALALNLPIVAEYYDPGISGGFLLMRTDFQAAIADIQAGRADTLICPNIARYSRDVEHQQSIKKAVRAAGGRLVFCDADFEDTASGDLNFTIQGGFAEYERKVIRERLDSGRVTRAKNGLQPSRRTSPYGYHIASHADVIRGEYSAAEVGRYFLREDQARIVRRIWADYHAGTHSLIGIARQLTREGVPTPGKSKQWSMTTVRYILANPVYKGMAIYGRFDNTTDENRLLETHWRTGEPLKEPRRRSKADPSTWITMDCPAIVTEEVWDAVQIRLTQNKAQKGGNPARVRMLAGRIFCPFCGQSLICGGGARRNRQGKIIAQPQRYSCGRYLKTVEGRGSGDCQPTGYLVADVEHSVIAAVLDAAQRPEALADALAAYTEVLPAEDGTEAARLELAAVGRALKTLEKEEAATVQAQIQGIMQGAPADAYAAAFADLAGRRKDMEDRRGALSRRVRATPGKKAAGTDYAGIPLDRQALSDTVLVLTSEEVSGQVKRDALAFLIEGVVPRRTAGDNPHRNADNIETEVRFLPGLFASDTLHTSRLGSDSTRALFSAMSALSWAASGKICVSGPPPVKPLPLTPANWPASCPNKIGCGVKE